MEEKKKQEIALFRYGVIHDFVSGDLTAEERKALLRSKSEQRWQIPHSGQSTLSPTTIRRWIRLYLASGKKIESLFPRPRNDAGKSRRMDEETRAKLVMLRKEHPRYPIRYLIERMIANQWVSPGIKLNPTGVYRFLHSAGVMRGETEKVDRRRFEAENPNDIWQADVMHGPQVLEEGRLRKTYLIALIDDHSRMITHGEFYLSENTDAFLQALRHAIKSRGIPKKLFVDNGSAFRSNHLGWVCAALGIALVHSRPYQPEGKGKIERFFGTVRKSMFLQQNPPTLAVLNTKLDLWLMHSYHDVVHSSTGQTPLNRFTASPSLLRSAPADLDRHFRKKALRKVSKDRVVMLEGLAFEAPASLIGERVELWYLPENPGIVEVVCKGKSYGTPGKVDVAINVHAFRERKTTGRVKSDQVTDPVVPEKKTGGGELKFPPPA